MLAGMSAMQTIPDPLATKRKAFTMDLTQAASVGGLSYDLCTASGADIVIDRATFLVTIAGATWTTTSVQTNESTPTVVLAALAAASFTLGTTLATTWTQTTPLGLRSGQKLRYTIVGASAGSGAVRVYLNYWPTVAGGDLV